MMIAKSASDLHGCPSEDSGEKIHTEGPTTRRIGAELVGWIPFRRMLDGITVLGIVVGTAAGWILLFLRSEGSATAWGVFALVTLFLFTSSCIILLRILGGINPRVAYRLLRVLKIVASWSARPRIYVLIGGIPSDEKLASSLGEWTEILASLEKRESLVFCMHITPLLLDLYFTEQGESYRAATAPKGPRLDFEIISRLANENCAFLVREEDLLDEYVHEVLFWGQENGIPILRLEPFLEDGTEAPLSVSEPRNASTVQEAGAEMGGV